MPSLSVSPPRPSGLSETARHQATLVLLCGAVFLTNLGGTHLWDEDEAYFGGTVAEMLRRGDHVVPYFNGELSLHKPAFMYWVMMLGVAVFGTCEFALRIGSAVFATGTVLVTYHVARMLFTPRVGFWSGVALATCLQFAVVARAAVSDPELIFFCTLALLAFVAARRGRPADGRSAARGDSGLSWRDWATCYAAMGAAVLVKGPVGAVLPTAVLGLTLLCEHADAVTAAGRDSGPWLRRCLRWLAAAFAPVTVARTIWAMRPLTALVMVAAVAAPWYVWVGLRTGWEWPRGFLLVHNLGRFSRTFEDHAGGPFYYLLAVVVGMFPWSIFLLQTVRGAAAGLAGDPSLRRAWQFLLANLVVWIGCFSLSGTKLPHYILPAYPALAIACGAFVAAWAAREVESPRGWLRVSWATLLVVGIAVLGGGGLALRALLPGETSIMLIGAVPLVGGLVGLWALETDRRGLASATLVATAAGFLLAILAWAAPRVSAHQTSPQVAAWVRSHALTPTPELKSFAFFQESLVFYADQPVEEYVDPAAVSAYFERRPHDAFLVTTREALESMRTALPQDVVELESMPRFLRPGEVVLLGRGPQTADMPGRSSGSRR